MWKRRIKLKVMVCIVVLNFVVFVLKIGHTPAETLYRMTLGKMRRTKEWPATNEQNVSKRYQCKLVEPKLSRISLPVTGLISFPGAGNTWTRHLIQQASGELALSCNIVPLVNICF